MSSSNTGAAANTASASTSASASANTGAASTVASPSGSAAAAVVVASPYPVSALAASHLSPIARWATGDRKAVCRRGKWLTVEEHSVTLPTGKVIPDWTWVESGHFINVLCVTSDERWLVFAQPKYAIGLLMQSNSFAPIGGYLDAGEDPLTAAKRELAEECGFVSEKWIPLHSGVADANRGCGVGHLFLALDATFKHQTASDDLEEQRPVWCTTAQIEELLFSNSFKCHSWTATVALSLLHWQRYKAGKASASASASTSAAAKK